MKVLIGYMTKCGASKLAAEAIGEVLREKYGMEVSLADLLAEPGFDIGPFDAVVVGSGVRMWRVYGKLHRFLERDFGNRKTALFISSMTAGDLKSREKGVKRFVTKTLGRHPNFQPVAAEAFGGRYVMRGKVVAENQDLEKVRKWAEEVGQKFLG